MAVYIAVWLINFYFEVIGGVTVFVEHSSYQMLAQSPVATQSTHLAPGTLPSTPEHQPAMESITESPSAPYSFLEMKEEHPPDAFPLPRLKPAPDVRVTCRQRKSSNSPFEGKSDFTFTKMGKSRQWRITGLRAHGITAYRVSVIPEIPGSAQLYLCDHSKPRNRQTTLDFERTLHNATDTDECVFYLFAKQFPDTKIRHSIRMTFFHYTNVTYSTIVFRDVRAAGHKYATGRKVKARQEALKTNEIFWDPEEGFRLIQEPQRPQPT